MRILVLFATVVFFLGEAQAVDCRSTPEKVLDVLRTSSDVDPTLPASVREAFQNGGCLYAVNIIDSRHLSGYVIMIDSLPDYKPAAYQSQFLSPLNRKDIYDHFKKVLEVQRAYLGIGLKYGMAGGVVAAETEKFSKEIFGIVQNDEGPRPSLVMFPQSVDDHDQFLSTAIHEAVHVQDVLDRVHLNSAADVRTMEKWFASAEEFRSFRGAMDTIIMESRASFIQGDHVASVDPSVTAEAYIGKVGGYIANVSRFIEKFNSKAFADATCGLLFTWVPRARGHRVFDDLNPHCSASGVQVVIRKYGVSCDDGSSFHFKLLDDDEVSTGNPTELRREVLEKIRTASPLPRSLELQWKSPENSLSCYLSLDGQFSPLGP